MWKKSVGPQSGPQQPGITRQHHVSNNNSISDKVRLGDQIPNDCKRIYNDKRRNGLNKMCSAQDAINEDTLKIVVGCLTIKLNAIVVEEQTIWLFVVVRRPKG